MKNTIGVDVSKDRLDVCACAGELHRQFSNDRRGIGDLVRWIEELGLPWSCSRRQGRIIAPSRPAWGPRVSFSAR